MYKKRVWKIFLGFMQALASPWKACDENETNKQTKKNDMCVKCYWWREGVYRVPVEK